ncbi:MAG: hypothetical protein M3256_18315 [Actinomycetota bacterium]|nr:hypothetical protein [Actinomycetota bacterium]
MPTVFFVSSGTLPAGLRLGSSPSISTPGILMGTPTTAGPFAFTVSASNGVAPDATVAVSGTV